MTPLADFIRENEEKILVEWEAFARQLPFGKTMDIEALRDHARDMLHVITDDLDTAQTSKEGAEKAMGKADTTAGMPDSAAQQHGAGRAESGFTIAHMVAEFRALRASVIRLWTADAGDLERTDLKDLIRFNEAIDQAIAESTLRYSEEVADSKERFIAILGHDLRNPLAAISMSSKFMLETGDLEEPHLTLASRIVSSSDRMARLITDLLDFTRTRFGDSIPIVRADMDLRHTVNAAVAEVGATAPDARVHVETSGDLRGQWDEERLAQALTNLVANAIHHGSPKSPVTVAAQGLPNEVRIIIHNDGPPIPRKDIAQLFTAMKPASGDGKRDRRHLGLGLYIVDKIIAAHGGSIGVESTREKGTRFTVRLPRHPE